LSKQARTAEALEMLMQASALAADIGDHRSLQEFEDQRRELRSGTK
jgi:hypothetical protein